MRASHASRSCYRPSQSAAAAALCGLFAVSGHGSAVADLEARTALANATAQEARRAAIVVAVADATTGAPVENALVAVPAIGRSARTNWLGEAVLGSMSVGVHRVQVRHVGYSPADLDVRVGAPSDTVGPAFLLEPRTAMLDTVAVRTTRLRRGPAEFEHRRRAAVGRFITDSALSADREPSLAANIAKRVPGLFVVVDQTGRYSLRTERTAMTGGRAQKCGIDVYRDGFRNPEPIDALLKSEVTGVEVYPMAYAPPQYRKGTGSCWVVLIWTGY